MTENLKDAELTQTAIRDTAAALRLYADGHGDQATAKLAAADPLASSGLLIGLVVGLCDLQRIDPREVADKLLLDAERHRMKLEQEQEQGDTDD